MSLGMYPDVSLKEARTRRDDARRTLSRGVDPCAARKAARATQIDTFEEVTREYLKLGARGLAEETVQTAIKRAETFLFPSLGSRSIAEIEAPELLSALRAMERRGLTDSVHRVKQLAGRVLRFAIATGRARHDVTADLRGALAPLEIRHHPALTAPADVGALLRAIDEYAGQPSARYALKLVPLVFLRSIELRGAEWSEIDFEASTWRVPGSRMKMGEEHLVPLCDRALELLRQLHAVTGHGRLLFPSLRSWGRCISDNTLNAALRRLGYPSDQQTLHGFRTIASTMLNELGWAPDLIELQLAHVERNSVRAAYNRAQRLTERRQMMEAWGTHVDAIKRRGQIASLRISTVA